MLLLYLAMPRHLMQLHLPHKIGRLLRVDIPISSRVFLPSNICSGVSSPLFLVNSIFHSLFISTKYYLPLLFFILSLSLLSRLLDIQPRREVNKPRPFVHYTNDPSRRRANQTLRRVKCARSSSAAASDKSPRTRGRVDTIGNRYSHLSGPKWRYEIAESRSITLGS